MAIRAPCPQTITPVAVKYVSLDERAEIQKLRRGMGRPLRLGAVRFAEFANSEHWSASGRPGERVRAAIFDGGMGAGTCQMEKACGTAARARLDAGSARLTGRMRNYMVTYNE